MRIFRKQNFVFIQLNFSNRAKSQRSSHRKELIFLESIFINGSLLQHSTISICSTISVILQAVFYRHTKLKDRRAQKGGKTQSPIKTNKQTKTPSRKNHTGFVPQILFLPLCLMGYIIFISLLEHRTQWHSTNFICYKSAVKTMLDFLKSSNCPKSPFWKIFNNDINKREIQLV